MPYITQEARDNIHENCEDPTSAGELNYLFTTIAMRYINVNKNYQRINDVIGALEGCKLELYRRVVAPYEDTKILENGDVY